MTESEIVGSGSVAALSCQTRRCSCSCVTVGNGLPFTEACTCSEECTNSATNHEDGDDDVDDDDQGEDE